MRKKIFIFFEFLVAGVLLGILEDFILIKIVTNEPFTFHIFWIVLIVTIPFAFLGEYVVDNINFLKIFNLNKKYKRLEVFFEFLVFGIILGVIEDLTAFYFSIGSEITIEVFVVAMIVSIPFAFVGEFLIDKVNFYESYKNRKLIFN